MFGVEGVAALSCRVVELDVDASLVGGVAEALCVAGLFEPVDRVASVAL